MRAVTARRPTALLFTALCALAAGCGDDPTPATPADAAPDVTADVAADKALDAGADAAPDAPGMDAVADATGDVARDAAGDASPDVANDARVDVAEAGADSTADAPADAGCAGAVEGGACAPEGAFCGGPCTNPCAFCNVLRCVGGRWGRLEVPPLPPDMCRDAGADAAADVADAGGLNCDPRTAACDSLPPPCMGGGEVREVRGGCWGDCVVYTRCRPIACDPEMTGQCPTNTVCFRTTRQCGLPVM